jgi:hypothetical protein
MKFSTIHVYLCAHCAEEGYRLRFHEYNILVLSGRHVLSAGILVSPGSHNLCNPYSMMFPEPWVLRVELWMYHLGIHILLSLIVYIVTSVDLCSSLYLLHKELRGALTVCASI